MEATQRAVAIEGRSEIASQLEKIAQRMIAQRMTASAGTVEGESASRRFIEFFSVTPVREKVGWKR
jgi:hypothetical protein